MYLLNLLFFGTINFVLNSLVQEASRNARLDLHRVLANEMGGSSEARYHETVRPDAFSGEASVSEELGNTSPDFGRSFYNGGQSLLFDERSGRLDPQGKSVPVIEEVESVGDNENLRPDHVEEDAEGNRKGNSVGVKNREKKENGERANKEREEEKNRGRKVPKVEVIDLSSDEGKGNLDV